ncbi:MULTISPECIES: hypothetical protein [Bradyrhizobium]|uniref:hypothetical protein n=1 Tax=Bradyrhizobium TaxID=374 RepID=UPI001CD28B27|nr:MULTISPECIES: hypothetical protein [Bradyrhizobium]
MADAGEGEDPLAEQLRERGRIRLQARAQLGLVAFGDIVGGESGSRLAKCIKRSGRADVLSRGSTA